CMQALDSPLTF
nr:immunoglobulin light chain junction region [Macaca mulatta]